MLFRYTVFFEIQFLFHYIFHLKTVCFNLRAYHGDCNQNKISLKNEYRYTLWDVSEWESKNGAPGQLMTKCKYWFLITTYVHFALAFSPHKCWFFFPWHASIANVQFAICIQTQQIYTSLSPHRMNQMTNMSAITRISWAWTIKKERREEKNNCQDTTMAGLIA